MNLFYIKPSAWLSLLLIGLLFFKVEEASSQSSRSEFSINASGIFPQLDYDLAEGYLDKDRGWGLGLGYSYYVAPQWAIAIEGNYQGYTSEARLQNLEGSHHTTDFEGEAFEFRYKAERFREQQQLEAIHIPLTLQFQTDGETKFYARAGGQVGIILNSDYRSSVSSLETSGYYAQYDAELFDPLFMGFGRYENINQPQQELDWDTSFAAVLEAGVKREAGRNAHLYIGFFLNYGLNTINQESETTALIEYQRENPSSFATNSLFESGYAKDARLRNFGIKLRYSIGGY